MSEGLYELAGERLTQWWAHRLPWITACGLGLSWIITMLLELLVDFLMKMTWLEMKPEARNEPSALGVVRQLMQGPLLSVVSS